MKVNPVILALFGVFVAILAFSFGQMNATNKLSKKLEDLDKKVGEVQNPQGGAPSVPARPPTPAVVTSAVGDSPVRGNANAKLTITEYSDFQCGFCAKFHNEAGKEIMKEYVDTGKAKFVYKNLAFLGPESTDAANAAFCAKEQNKFWEYHDLLFEKHSGDKTTAFAKNNLKSYAVKLGLNASQFNSCFDGTKYASQIQADFEEANKNGFQSTPSFAIGSTPLVGAQPYASFKKIIDAELAKIK